MSISQKAFETWLVTYGHERRLLLELDHSGGTEYLSDKGYIARPLVGDRRIYEGALLSESGIQSRLDGQVTLGEIEIVNGGYRDAWLDYHWHHREIRYYLGDPSWPIEDFQLVARANIEELDSVDSSMLRFTVADSDAVFDTPIAVGTLPGGNPNPITLGRPFNVPAALVDNATHKYRLNDIAIASASARVNGSAIQITGDYANGGFTMASHPTGNLCADPIEVTDTAEKIATWVVGLYGVTVNATSLAALPSYVLGLHYPSEVTGRQILDDVAASIGGYWRRNVLGELELDQMTEPKETADFTLRAGDIVNRGLTRVNVHPPVSKLTIAYQKNYSVSDRNSLAGILSNDPTLADKLTNEWCYSSTTNVVPDYPDNETVRETYLTSSTDAATESVRQAALRAVPRKVWRVDCRLAPALVQKGDTVRVIYPCHGFNAGKNGVVLSVDKAHTHNAISLDVWI